MLIWRQVGRPWLHWSLRSVASMSRSRPFISSTVSLRALDAGAGLMLAEFGQHAARQFDGVALRQRRGHGAHGQGFGREGRNFQTQMVQGFGMRLGRGHFDRRGGKGLRDQEGLTGQALQQTLGGAG